jgi:hypothetical protein
MRLLDRPAVGRSGAVMAAVGLLLGGVFGVPERRAEAAAPPVGTGGTLVTLGGDMATLEPATGYTLSPQLTSMLGTTTLDAAGLSRLQAAARPALSGEPTPPVGTTLLWPAIDASKVGVTGLYLKPYTLRAVGSKIEVWVATGCDAISCGTAFPSGDCRNAVPGSTDVTDSQIHALIKQFDENMYPTETATFSTPRERNGTATVPGIAAAGVDFAGDGTHTVTLIDNVRDPNFYEFPKNKTYVAGFFAPIFNQLTDRNVMTIDAFDWVHRTGADPANEPDADLCKSRPARARAYEGVFAHEWQHLLESYQDPTESTWVNEGLSDFAISLVGYADTRRNVDQLGAQSHIFCFHGYGTVKGLGNPNPTPCGGPENSLTLWQDEGTGSEVLADYGNAWSFMLFLHDRYGSDFIRALHQDGAHRGLAGVSAQLARFASGTKVADVLHDFQLMNLVGHYAAATRSKVFGIEAARVRTASLDAMINLDNPACWAIPGAAPNGADYMLLRDGNNPIPGNALRSFDFIGNHTVIPTEGPFAKLPILGSPADFMPVQNWHVSLVGIDPVFNRVLVRSFDQAFTASADAAALKAFASYPRVVAVVAHDDTDDTNSGAEFYAGYQLRINGVLQPGG